MRRLFVFACFFLLAPLGWAALMYVAVPSPESYKFSPAHAARELERLAREWERRPNLHRETFKGTVHLELARYYQHEGHAAKAEEHIGKIRQLWHPESLLQLYTSKMLEEIDAGDVDAALKMIVNRYQLNEQVARLEVKNDKHLLETLSTTYMNDIEKEYPDLTPGEQKTLAFSRAAEWLSREHRIKPEIVDSTLCRLAVTGLLRTNREADIEKLVALDVCAAILNPGILRDDRIQYLIYNGGYEEAFDLWSSGRFPDEESTPWAWKYRLDSHADCLRPDVHPLGSSKAASLSGKVLATLPDKDVGERNAAFLFRVLTKNERFDEAWQLGERMEADVAKAYLLPAYEYFYRQGDREKVLAFWDRFDTRKSGPVVVTRGLNDISVDPWFLPIPEARVFAEHPSSLGFELVLQIQNPAARFVALNRMSHALQKHPGLPPPDGCTTSFKECLALEMFRSFVHETDEMRRNRMALMLATVYSEYDIEKTFEFLDLTSDAGIGTCHGDTRSRSSPPAPIAAILKQPGCLSYLDRLSRFVDTEVLLDAKRTDLPMPTEGSMSLIVCHAASGAYKDVLKSGTLHGRTKEAYLLTLSEILFNSNKHDAMVNAVSVAEIPGAAGMLDFLGFRENRLNHTRGSSGHSEKERQKLLTVLEAMARNEDLSAKAELWEELAARLVEAKAVELLEAVHRIKPDLALRFPVPAHSRYLFRDCTRWASEFPPRDQVERVADLKYARPAESCFRPLIREGKYEEALHAAKALRDSDWAVYEIYLEILKTRYARESWPYRLTMIDNYGHFPAARSPSCDVLYGDRIPD